MHDSPSPLLKCSLSVACLGWVLCVFQGCNPSSSPTDEKGGGQTEQTPAVAALRGSDSVVPGSSQDAKRLMEQVLTRYRSYERYFDAGELRVEAPGSPSADIPFRVAFERPNHLAFVVHNASGTWTSATWEGICAGVASPFPNQRLVRPLPDRIDFDWIASDYLGGLFVEPVGIPIQLEWLLSTQSLEVLKDSTCKLEFLQRDSIDERLCDRVRMEVQGMRYVFWIERENQLIRRLELPPKLFRPGISDEQLSGIRCQIDFRGVAVNQSIDWSRWQVPERPADIRVRRMVMPPPIASTQILGTTLAPFDLKAADNTLLLDAAEPKRPISALCWIDTSAQSEACVRELMAFRKLLVEQGLGGQCGIYLIAKEASGELVESLKKWNCDLPLAVDQQSLSDSLFNMKRVPSLMILDRDRRVQVAEVLTNPISPPGIVDLVRRIENKEDLASRQMQQDADNQARFIAALHRVAIDKEEVKRLEAIREFQFALHGMSRAWRTPLSKPLVSAGGAWYPDAAIAEVPKTQYPFSGSNKPVVMSLLDEEGKVLVLDDLGASREVGRIEIDQADGAKRIHTAIDPWSHQWIAVVPEGLPRFWIVPSQLSSVEATSKPPLATTYNTGEFESPIAFAWTKLESDPAIAIATTESRLLVINPKTEKRFDAVGEATIAIAPSMDIEGKVFHWNAVSSSGRLEKIPKLASDSVQPIEARLEQLTFPPRAGAWLWGRHGPDAITLSLAGMSSGETGVAVCNRLHQTTRSIPITAIGEQARLLSTVRLADGTLYCLASGPSRVLHLFTADLMIVDQVSFDSRIFGAALFTDGKDLKLVVALEKEVSAWTIDVPDRLPVPSGQTLGTGNSGGLSGQ
jgi:hypothetical protein